MIDTDNNKMFSGRFTIACDHCGKQVDWEQIQISPVQNLCLKCRVYFFIYEKIHRRPLVCKRERMATLKVILFCSFLLSSTICIAGCSSVKMVLDDISRDTYESKVRKAHRIENLEDPTQIGQEPPTYDQYQRERKKLTSDHEETSPAEH